MESKESEKKNEVKEKEELPNIFDVLPDRLKPILINLPEEEREKAAHIIMKQFSMIMTKTSFSGPIPPPELLKGYEEVLNGSAERILRMAENQSKHRQEIEKLVITSQMKQTERGQYFGLGIGIFGLILGFVLTILGHSTVAGILFTTTIIGLVSVFVIGKLYSDRKKAKEETE